MMSRRALLFALAASPAAAHAIDWRSLLHGEPAAPPKAPPPKELAQVSLASGMARDAEVEAFLRALADALKARDGRPMVARLSDKYAIDSLPDGSKAPEVFVQAVERIPGPTEIVIQGIERTGGTRVVTTEFRYGTAPAKAKTFRFDATGRLAWSDLFNVSVQRHGH